MLYILGGYAIYISMLLISREIINNELVNSEASPMLGKFPLLTLATFVGFQSGITGVCLKATVELIKTQLQGYDNFGDNFQAFLFPLTIVVSVTLHVIFLNVALKYYDALLLVPLVQSSLIFYNIMAGGIILDEFSTFS